MISSNARRLLVNPRFLILLGIILALYSCIDFVPPSTQHQSEQFFEERKAWLTNHAAQLESTKQQLSSISDEYSAESNDYKRTHSNADVNIVLYPKYREKLDRVLSPIIDSHSLAWLALWAQQKDPWLQSSCPIFSYTFALTLIKLAKSKQPHAAEEIQDIERIIKQNGHFDGHIAEMIKEAEDESRKR